MLRFWAYLGRYEERLKQVKVEWVAGQEWKEEELLF